MREIRPSGSEGGGTEPNRSSLPLSKIALGNVKQSRNQREGPRRKAVACAPASLLHQRGASPRRGVSGTP